MNFVRGKNHTHTGGINSTHLDGGQPADSKFKMPFNVTHHEIPTSHIMHSSGEVTILEECKDVVLEEATLLHKYYLQSLDNITINLK